MTSAGAEEAEAGHQARLSTSESVVCAINSSLEINQVEKNDDNIFFRVVCRQLIF